MQGAQQLPGEGAPEPQVIDQPCGLLFWESDPCLKKGGVLGGSLGDMWGIRPRLEVAAEETTPV